MTKNIYGLVDIKTHNFGDICLLDRDEEFRSGCISLLSNPDIPDYVVRDLICVRYGSVSYDSTVLYPKFVFDDIPTIILYGVDVLNSRLNSREEVSQNAEEVEADC